MSLILEEGIPSSCVEDEMVKGGGIPICGRQLQSFKPLIHTHWTPTVSLSWVGAGGPSDGAHVPAEDKDMKA